MNSRESSLKSCRSLIALVAFVALAGSSLLANMSATKAFVDCFGTCTGTTLLAGQKNSNSVGFTEECTGNEGLEPGQVLWHFVLTQVTAENTQTLTACFQTAGTQTKFPADKNVGHVLMWNIITDADDILLNACTDAVGKNLVLSHVCHGGGGEGDRTSSITTEVHLGADDSAGTIVVGPCNALAPATVHDSAQVLTTPADPLPEGSTVTFLFYTNNTCSGEPVFTSDPFDVSGQVLPSVDPGLVRGPLGPGCYAFKAVFTSGDHSATTGFPDATSDCEPFCVYNAPLTPGYWKTHLAPISDSCSSKQGCSANGPWTIDCLPNLKLGDYEVGTTANATAIWNLMNCGNSGSNSAQNQNAIGCLAGHLLATKLNICNGSDPCISATVTLADNFLKTIPYVGPTGNYTGITSSQRSTAISLKTALDTYNNGGGCNNFCH